MTTNKAIVEQGFEDWTSGSGRFFDLLADDVTWTITGSSPIAGTYESRQAFLDAAIGPLMARLSTPITPTLRALYAEGDTVIALFDGKATARDGRPYTNTYSWYLTFDGEQIVEVVAFFDGIALADLWNRVAPSE